MKWHKISEELPNFKGLVLLWQPKRLLDPIVAFYNNKRFVPQGANAQYLDYYTHWAEIEPPEDANINKTKTRAEQYEDMGFPEVKAGCISSEDFNKPIKYYNGLEDLQQAKDNTEETFNE